MRGAVGSRGVRIVIDNNSEEAKRDRQRIFQLAAAHGTSDLGHVASLEQLLSELAASKPDTATEKLARLFNAAAVVAHGALAALSNEWGIDQDAASKRLEAFIWAYYLSEKLGISAEDWSDDENEGDKEIDG
jgi:hypothetical protein